MVETRSNSVFVNCPFDREYAPIHDAIIFAILACGFKARSGLEIADSGELRLLKIVRLLGSAKFSIHDLSRIELDPESALPRFNMPLELGIALGMKHLGRRSVIDHALLILDAEPFRYLRFASDLAGVDISEHGNTPARAISRVRDFLAPHKNGLPDGDTIFQIYLAFEDRLPSICATARQSVASLTFIDRLRHIQTFLEILQPE